MGLLLPPIVLELKAKASELVAATKESSAAVDEMQEKTEGSSSKMQSAFNKTAGAGKALAFGVAGAGVAIGAFAIESATAAQKVDAQLSVAVTNAGGSMEELDPKIQQTDASLRKFGFTNEETNTALTSATVALGDPAKAMSVMSVAADLAREKNLDLNTATMLVTKGMEGQTKPLKALGIDLPVYAGNAQAVSLAQAALAKAQQNVNDILDKTPDAADASSKAHDQYVKATQAVTGAQSKLAQTQSSGDQILASLTERVKGAGDAYGNTLQGQLAAAKAQLDNMGESIGKKLIPVITMLLTKGSEFANWLMAHKPVLIAFAAVVGTVVVGAILAWVASMVMAAAANIAAAAPVLLIVAAVALLAAGFMYAYTHSKTFHDIVDKIGKTLKVVYETVLKPIGEFFMKNWKVALEIALAAVMPFIGIPLLIITHWHQILDFFEALPGLILGYLKDAGMWLLHMGEDVLTGAWNGLMAALPKIGEFMLNLPFYIIGLVAGLGVLLVETGISLLMGLLNGIVGFAPTLWAWFTSLPGFVLGLLGGLGSLLVQGGLDLLTGLWNGAKTVWGDVTTWVAGIPGDFVTGVGVLLNTLEQAGEDLITGLWNGMIAIWTDVTTWISGVATAITNFLGITGGAKSAATSAVTASNGQSTAANTALAGNVLLDGGWTTGAVGKAIPNSTVHGGEYMLSNAMLNGSQTVDPAVLAKLGGGKPNSNGSAPANVNASPVSGNSPTVNVYAQTNATPAQIASLAGWTLRQMSTV